MLETTYAAYLVISIGLTVWVGRTLSRNGRVFLARNYPETELVEAITNMLLVGFYLINIGFVAYSMKIYGEEPRTYADVMEFLSVKVGLIAIILGLMHFALMFVLQRFSGLVRRVVPVAPTDDTGEYGQPRFVTSYPPQT